MRKVVPYPDPRPTVDSKAFLTILPPVYLMMPKHNLEDPPTSSWRWSWSRSEDDPQLEKRLLWWPREGVMGSENEESEEDVENDKDDKEWDTEDEEGDEPTWTIFLKLILVSKLYKILDLDGLFKDLLTFLLE